LQAEEEANRMPFSPVTTLNPYTLPGLLKKNASMLPKHDCVVAPEYDVCWSWEAFDCRTDEIARGLYAMGIRKGDHIAIWAANVPEWMLIMFGSANLGAVLVTVNTNYKTFELNYLLAQSDAKMLIMSRGTGDNNYISHITSIMPSLNTHPPEETGSRQLPFLKSVVLIGQTAGKPMGIFSFSDIYAKAEKVPQSLIDEIIFSLDTHDTINMQYTSGTTGFPKGVMLTHFNITNNGQFMGDCMKLTPEDRLLLVVPLFHCFGCVLGVMSCLTHGTAMVLMEKFNPLKEMELITQTRCTAVHGVPTMFIGMLEHPDFCKFDFSRLRTGIMAGSPCPIKTMQDVTEKMHLSELTITYGLTESSPGITMSRTDDPLDIRCTTVGKLLPHAEGKIIDPKTGAECPYDTPGEICTRGYHVMKGYYKMPEATSQAIDQDGWLHTGDIGTMDKNGNFRITGRLKDMIIRGGENIYPREIEEFLYTHHKVCDVQVVGIPDRKYGEEVCACVILREGVTAEEGELIDFVKNGISRFKAPRYILFMDSFPMTASGKIQKYKLREIGAQQLGLQSPDELETV